MAYMSQASLWWGLAGAAVIVQLLTGTFHFLMLAAVLAAGAVTAQLGGSFVLQILAAAVVGGGALVAWYLARRGRPADLPAAANRDVHMDIGETVQIDTWNVDGTANTFYRGANWLVIHRPGAIPSAGLHRVAEVIGSRLLVDKI